MWSRNPRQSGWERREPAFAEGVHKGVDRRLVGQVKRQDLRRAARLAQPLHGLPALSCVPAGDHHQGAAVCAQDGRALEA